MQVSFTPDGKALVVTEKNSSTLRRSPRSTATAWLAPRTSSLGRRHARSASTSAAAPALSPESRGLGFVLQREPGQARGVISGAVSTHQAAPCWLDRDRSTATTPHTANAGSGSLSGLVRRESGALTLLDASGVTASLGAGQHPLDETVSTNGEFLAQPHRRAEPITGLPHQRQRQPADPGRPDRRPAGRRGRDRRFLVPLGAGRPVGAPVLVVDSRHQRVLLGEGWDELRPERGGGRYGPQTLVCAADGRHAGRAGSRDVRGGRAGWPAQSAEHGRESQAPS